MRHERPLERSLVPSPEALGDAPAVDEDAPTRPINLMVMGGRLTNVQPLLQQPGVRLVAETSSAATAVDLAVDGRPDVILMEINVGPGVASVIRAITTAAPDIGVVVLASDPEDPRILSALAAGASGCLAGDPSADELWAAVQTAAHGESVISARVARQVVGHVRERLDGDVAASGLTARELEVLRLLARGWDNARIGEALYLSRGTVKHHISSILTKLQVDNRIQAAVRAVRGGLVDD
jgi:two-component system, NarL family, response regulator LiaR